MVTTVMVVEILTLDFPLTGYSHKISVVGVFTSIIIVIHLAKPVF